MPKILPYIIASMPKRVSFALFHIEYAISNYWTYISRSRQRYGSRTGTASRSVSLVKNMVAFPRDPPNFRWRAKPPFHVTAVLNYCFGSCRRVWHPSPSRDLRHRTNSMPSTFSSSEPRQCQPNLLVHEINFYITALDVFCRRFVGMQCFAIPTRPIGLTPESLLQFVARSALKRTAVCICRH